MKINNIESTIDGKQGFIDSTSVTCLGLKSRVSWPKARLEWVITFFTLCFRELNKHNKKMIRIKDEQDDKYNGLILYRITKMHRTTNTIAWHYSGYESSLRAIIVLGNHSLRADNNTEKYHCKKGKIRLHMLKGRRKRKPHIAWHQWRGKIPVSIWLRNQWNVLGFYTFNSFMFVLGCVSGYFCVYRWLCAVKWTIFSSQSMIHKEKRFYLKNTNKRLEKKLAQIKNFLCINIYVNASS